MTRAWVMACALVLAGCSLYPHISKATMADVKALWDELGALAAEVKDHRADHLRLASEVGRLSVEVKAIHEVYGGALRLHREDIDALEKGCRK